jgi:tRNA pseudouridine38-40 synthase
MAYLMASAIVVQADNRRNILVKLEYCGTNFAGWQYQRNARTVQGVIKENLEKFLRQNVKLTGSGRTDSGVHALAQYANFVTHSALKTADIKHRLNRLLPPDVVVLACRDVPLRFDARRLAVWRDYRYLIFEKPSAIKRDFCWVIEQRLDLALLNRLASLIKDATDFGNFCKTRSLKENNECRVMRAAWSRRTGFLRFDIRANRFLHNMVRLLVGTMIAVCNGRTSYERFKKMLDDREEKSRYIAPARGLYLVGVGYERGNL